MPAITVEAAAKSVAGRVDSSKVSFGFEMLLPILVQVLTSLITGCGREEEPAPVKVNAKVKALNEANPTRLLRRTTAAVIRDARPKRLKRTEAEELARAIIEEACESSPARVASVFRSLNG